MGEEKPAEDKLIQTIGEFGKWQLLLLLLLCVPAKLSATWTLLGIIFLAPNTQFRCVERANSTQDISNNTCYSDCSKYDYVTDFEITIISQWDLVCERAWMVNLSQTVLMIGVLLGNIFFGFVADSPNYWVFTAIRLFLGASTAGLMAVTFVLTVEIIGSKKREIVTTFYHLPFAVGQMILPFFSYYLRSWKRFSFGLGLTNLIFLLNIFLLSESPKWLISMGRLKEASKIMKKVAKFNNLTLDNDTLEIAKNISREQSMQCGRNETTTVSYLVFFTHPTLRLRNLCSCIAWFCLGISLYGGSQYIGQTSSNVFLSIMLAGALQVPGILISGCLYKRFGRKPTIMGFYLGSAVCSGLLAIPNEWFYLKLIASAMAITCSVGAFTIMYTFTSELFPTLTRNMAMGASSTASRVGSMFAPFVVGLNQLPWLPPVVFAVIPLLAAAVCCYLPETKGMKLMDRMENEQ